MSEVSRVLLVGASGLVGGEVIRAALGRKDLRLIALARRAIALPEGAKMEMLVADPEGWGEAIGEIAPDRVICALGTTWAKAGKSEAAFRAVDQQMVLHVAQRAKEAGATSFVLVSSVGADAGSRNFYLRVKGEVEQSLQKLGYRRTDILRPGLLRGDRGGERRILERAGIVVAPVMNLLLHGKRRRYRAIHGSVVAEAALQCAREKQAGRFVHHNDEIRRLAGRWRR